MNRKLLVIYLNDGSSERLDAYLKTALQGVEHEEIHDTEPLNEAPELLKNRRILFAVPLGNYGVNLIYSRFLAHIRAHGDCLKGSLAGLVIDGCEEIYTKSTATELVYSANGAACRFIGKPLVEATGSLLNFHVLSKVGGTTLEETYHQMLAVLIDRLMNHTTFEESGWCVHRHHYYELPPLPENLEVLMGEADKGHKKPVVLVLHASNRKVSNTLDLWTQVRHYLENECEIVEVGLRNGEIEDCAGCSFNTCLHFGERGKCVYGGVVVDEVYPALLRADALVFLCANYNDSLQANVTACINRLTALFRKNFFWDKKIFGLVVSGYSGGDIIARQLIAALNMNKSFQLPPHFSLLVTANDRGSLLKIPGIQAEAEAFAAHILEEIKP